jgi:hypothetical protein
MPIQPITYFEGDSWKKQPEESERGHHYFKQYKKQHLSRDKFVEFVLSEADKRTTEGQLKFWGTDAKFNKDHQEEIQLYVDTNGKEGRCPKPCSTLPDYFYFHQWFHRKKEYDAYQDEEADLLIRAMITEEKPQIAADIIENIKLTNRQRKRQKQSGQGTLSQDAAGAKSINTDIDSLNKLSNNDVQKVDVNADVEAKAEVETKADIAQDIILKPEYVELTRKLLEDVVNDS